MRKMKRRRKRELTVQNDRQTQQDHDGPVPEELDVGEVDDAEDVGMTNSVTFGVDGKLLKQ